MTRIVRRLAAAVAVAAVFLLAVSSQRVIEGTARPAPGDTKLVVLTLCVREKHTLRGLDLDAVQVGPLIRDSTGDRIFGLTKDRTLIDCGNIVSSTRGPLNVLPPEEKARIAGLSFTEDAGMVVGFGQVALDVARLDAVLKDGKVARAKLAGGLFAFVAEDTDTVAGIVLRTYDRAGDLTYESKPRP